MSNQQNERKRALSLTTVSSTVGQVTTSQTSGPIRKKPRSGSYQLKVRGLQIRAALINLATDYNEIDEVEFIDDREQRYNRLKQRLPMVQKSLVPLSKDERTMAALIELLLDFGITACRKDRILSGLSIAQSKAFLAEYESFYQRLFVLFGQENDRAKNFIAYKNLTNSWRSMRSRLRMHIHQIEQGSDTNQEADDDYYDNDNHNENDDNNENGNTVASTTAVATNNRPRLTSSRLSGLKSEPLETVSLLSDFEQQHKVKEPRKVVASQPPVLTPSLSDLQHQIDILTAANTTDSQLLRQYAGLAEARESAMIAELERVTNQSNSLLESIASYPKNYLAKHNPDLHKKVDALPPLASSAMSQAAIAQSNALLQTLDELDADIDTAEREQSALRQEATREITARRTALTILETEADQLNATTANLNAQYGPPSLAQSQSSSDATLFARLRQPKSLVKEAQQASTAYRGVLATHTSAVTRSNTSRSNLTQAGERFFAAKKQVQDQLRALQTENERQRAELDKVTTPTKPTGNAK